MKKLNYIAGTILLLVFLYSSLALEDIAQGIVSIACIFLGILLFVANLVYKMYSNKEKREDTMALIIYSILAALFLYFIS